MAIEIIEDTKCIKEAKSGKAILVDIHGDEHWIPNSVIHEDSEVYKSGTEGDLIVERWFAEKEGLL